MCYSAESSITSFIIGGSACSYLLLSNNNYNKHIGLFFFSVLLIQLVEFFLWIDQDCGWLNNMASRSINFVLTIQICCLFLGAYLFNTIYISKNTLKILIFISTLFLLFNLYPFFETSNRCSRPYTDNSLKWDKFEKTDNLYNKIYNVSQYFYLLSFLIIPLLFKKIWIGLLILILSFTSFFTTRYANIESYTSRWCYFSAFIPVLFVFLDFFKIKY